ncbi:MAG: ABC transporter permease [Flavitalea sp.]
MPKPYSQLRAMLSITRGSLKAIFRSPSAVIFSFAFPLIFILVFGFIGSGGRPALKVAFDPQTDTTSILYTAIKSVSGIVVLNQSNDTLRNELSKGRITAIMALRKNAQGTPAYSIRIITSNAVNPQNVRVLRSILEEVINNINRKIFPENYTFAAISNEVETVPGRVYRTIDFILPGQLGFSLLSAGVFGVAFIFFSLRQTLVLKRFFATPIKRSYIVFGEALSRVIFQMSTAIVILLIGHFAFHFTLVHGFVTLIELLFLSFLGLAVFMGFGFVVSGLAKSESSIPPFANLFTLPQFLLAGTFFPVEDFPTWLQPICKILPLTHLNNAMRNVAFEGASLADCGTELGILLIWGVVAYALAIKFFKWGD